MNADRANRYPTPREFVDEWETKTDAERLAIAERLIRDAQTAYTCFVMDHDNHIAMLEAALDKTRSEQNAALATAYIQGMKA